MSDTDSFIEEVTEEVRRDRLFKLMKRYGWIPALIVIATVAGTGWNEYNKAKDRSAAETLGDDIIAALAVDESDARAEAFANVTAGTPGGKAMVEFLRAAALSNSEQKPQAVEILNAVAVNGDLPEIYRQIAAFKALTLQADTMPTDERRRQFEALAQPGQPLRLLAEEQLGLIDIAEGKRDQAIERFQAILQDAELSLDLRDRVIGMIIALGGEPQTLVMSQG